MSATGARASSSSDQSCSTVWSSACRGSRIPTFFFAIFRLPPVSASSPVAVAVESAADIAAAVRFAADRGLGLVVERTATTTWAVPRAGCTAHLDPPDARRYRARLLCPSGSTGPGVPAVAVASRGPVARGPKRSMPGLAQAVEQSFAKDGPWQRR